MKEYRVEFTKNFKEYDRMMCGYAVATTTIIVEAENKKAATKGFQAYKPNACIIKVERV